MIRGTIAVVLFFLHRIDQDLVRFACLRLRCQLRIRTLRPVYFTYLAELDGVSRYTGPSLVWVVLQRQLVECYLYRCICSVMTQAEGDMVIW